jgi:predicted ATPase/serine phosphatase RsbU (regulator of sigma subunit)
MFTIHDIDLLDELYQSEDSIVFKGYEKLKNQNVIVKILKEDFPSTNLIAQFNGEYEITNRYDLQGIRRVLAKRKIQNKHILILEYIDGVTIAEYIKNKPIDLITFLKLAIRCAEILSEIHQAGIIHKDINPNNILVTTDNKIKIIDFGAATSIKKELQTNTNLYILEGTLPYISPEQTGRMNRSVDYRSDLYSLGVTFYEMLTGQLPFMYDDAIELVHSHIARYAKPAHEIRKEIPKVLSDIVAKLMEKNAENRYQSAYGLQMDLSSCLKQWQTKRSIVLDKLAANDVFNIFKIPEKLYGRQEEIHQLMSIFDRTTRGNKEMVLVAGKSGIGKTSLVNEIHKPMTESNAYFIKGKFEQFQRDLPYSAIIQAFNDLASQILAEPIERLQTWKDEILASLKENGQVLLDVLPKFELIIGKQALVIDLPPAERQNRFNHIFQSFIRDICKDSHPIILFIDDWQWADMASLNLLKLLMTDISNHSLLVIGAYRDNEVDDSHPFVHTVESIKKSGGIVQTITLDVLTKASVNQIVSDTLHTSSEEVDVLSNLIFQKTNGSPFFVNQFLNELYERNYLIFDSEQHCWIWDIEQIQSLDSTDNVVELLVNKIQRFKPYTQKALQLGACIGNNFPLKVLSYINDKNQLVTLNELKEAIEEGVIYATRGNINAVSDETIDANVYFKFLHDNVEQAAYSMISKTIREQTQLKIGRILQEKNTQEYIEEFLFDITNYFNAGKEFITEDYEKQQVINLNIRAAKKAKDAAAYKSALKYLEVAEELLGENLWNTHHNIAYHLYKEKGENYFLIGEFKLSDSYLKTAFENSNDVFEKVNVLQIKMMQLSAQGQFHEGVRTIIEAVGLLGEKMPQLDDKVGLQNATNDVIAYILKEMENRTIESIYDFPVVQDKSIRKILELLVVSLDIVIMGIPDLIALFSGQIVKLVLKHGLTEMVSFGFSFWGVVMAGGFKKYAEAYKFAELAFKIEQNKLPNKGIKAKLAALGGYSTAFEHHLRRCAEVEMEGYYAGLENGDMVYCCYCYAISTRFTVLLDLKEANEIWRKSIPFLKPLSFPSYCIASTSASFVKLLQSPLSKENPYTFEYEDFHEKIIIENDFEQVAPLIYALFKRYKTLTYLIYEEFELAMVEVYKRQPLIAALGGLDPIFKVDFHLSATLVIGELFHKASDNEKVAFLEIVEESIFEVGLLANVCEINFKGAFLACKAIKAFITNNIVEAMDNFEEAILATQKYEIPQHEAIITEAVARFYIHRQKNDIAKLYYQKAQYAYKIWGAEGKLAQLETQYPDYISKRTNKFFKTQSNNNQGFTRNISSNKNISEKTHQRGSSLLNLDISSVMKATQAISGEIKIDHLLSKMIEILIENAGAERGLLIQKDAQQQLIVNAEGFAEGKKGNVMQELPIEKCELPLSIIRYVERTQEILVLDEATKDRRFAYDLYIHQKQAKSIFCAPIMIQGKVIAILYLENNLSNFVFDEDNTQILSILSAQIAISLENASLYANLENKVEERTQELNLKNNELYEKNVRITDSVRYAMNIQAAILPLESEMSRLFPQHFIIYKPKDLVSGDFYWISEVEKYRFVSVIDCTGHGVPGAFMSMLGHSLLIQIVNENKKLLPSEILLGMHEGIGKSLKQSETDNKDGMDVCICRLEDYENQKTKVLFAGARRPLYYIINEELQEIKGNRYSIGGVLRTLERKYQDHEIIMPKESLIYLSSDGLADQANKKRDSFSMLRLRAFIAQNCHLEIAQQKDLLLSDWEFFRQETEQRDDVTLIGIRL